jgi:hypothetical protein
MNNKGIQHHIAPFSCTLQWFRNRKVSIKIAKIGLFFVYPYSIKALTFSMLIILATFEENKTNPKMVKVTT